jgi:hypothetical protein
MTRTTNARIAGFTFLFYIAAGLSSMILFGRATSGDGIAQLGYLAHVVTNARVRGDARAVAAYQRSCRASNSMSPRRQTEYGRSSNDGTDRRSG